MKASVLGRAHISWGVTIAASARPGTGMQEGGLVKSSLFGVLKMKASQKSYN